MEIEEAFTQDQIDAWDTNVEGDVEEQLREVIQRVYSSAEESYSPTKVNIAMLCFVAGRTYQIALDHFTEPTIPIKMPPSVLVEFVDYLLQRGES